MSSFLLVHVCVITVHVIGREKNNILVCILFAHAKHQLMIAVWLQERACTAMWYMYFYLILVMRNRSSGFPTRSHTNRAVLSQKMARDLKFRMYVVEGLYYPYSENKGADQLCGYREADLRLCFRICKKLVFS